MPMLCSALGMIWTNLEVGLVAGDGFFEAAEVAICVAGLSPGGGKGARFNSTDLRARNAIAAFFHPFLIAEGFSEVVVELRRPGAVARRHGS